MLYSKVFSEAADVINIYSVSYVDYLNLSIANWYIEITHK